MPALLRPAWRNKSERLNLQEGRTEQRHSTFGDGSGLVEAMVSIRRDTSSAS